MRLGDIAKERRETYKGDKGGIRLVGLEHLITGELRFAAYDIDTENTFSKVFHKGDILFGRRRAYLKKAAIAEFDGICSGDITVIQAIPSKVYPDLLPFIIQNDSLFDFAVSRSAGGLSPRVKWEHLAEYEFELPSIDEQWMLAEKLWAAYNLKEAYKKMIVATDEMVKSQFIEMFENKGYETKELKTLINKSFPGEWGTDDKDGSGTMVIRTTNITNEDKLDLTEVVTRSIALSKLDQKKLAKGDILLERSGGTKDYPVGRVAFFESEGAYVTNNFTQTLRCINGVESKYLFYFLFIYYKLNKMKIRSMGNQTTGIQNLNIDDYMQIAVILPPIETQKQFIEIVKQADKSKFELKQAIDKIDKVMKSLLQ